MKIEWEDIIEWALLLAMVLIMVAVTYKLTGG